MLPVQKIHGCKLCFVFPAYDHCYFLGLKATKSGKYQTFQWEDKTPFLTLQGFSWHSGSPTPEEECVCFSRTAPELIEMRSQDCDDPSEYMCQGNQLICLLIFSPADELSKSDR